MYEDINNPALIALMGAAAVVAYIFLSTGLKALANRTSHFDIVSPVLRSCFDCENGLIVMPPSGAPNPPAEKVLRKTTMQCREMLRDESRLTDQDYMENWSFAYDHEFDYTAVATRCTKFCPKIVNKDGSIG